MCAFAQHASRCPSCASNLRVCAGAYKWRSLNHGSCYFHVCLHSSKHAPFFQYGCQRTPSIIRQRACAFVSVDGQYQTRSSIRVGPLEAHRSLLLQAEHKLLPLLQQHKLMYGPLPHPRPAWLRAFFSPPFQNTLLVLTAPFSLDVNIMPFCQDLHPHEMTAWCSKLLKTTKKINNNWIYTQN